MKQTLHFNFTAQERPGFELDLFIHPIYFLGE